MKTFNLTTLILTILGSINWGVYAIFRVDAISYLFGVDTLVTNFLFILFALSALWQIVPFVRTIDMDEEIAEVTAGRTAVAR